jgi:hypothetical protein
MNMRAIAVALLCVAGFAFVASPVLADHGDENEVVSHASTAHEHDSSAEVEVTVTSAPVVAVSDVVRLQQLLNALEQLVELLKQKAQLEHDATPHEHEAEDHEAEAEYNDEDHE